MPGAARTDDLIDARALAGASSVEALAAKADELVRSMEDPTALLAKPCSTLREAPDVLTCFGMLLGALAPLPGMTVLDFGAGSCWTSHFLTQLGCRVVAMDVSDAMLDLGRRRYAQQPVFGERPEPTFSRFDGHTMALEDRSVDRVLCFDALHHVPNVPEVLGEMARVLRPGAVAGFSEPGPEHSRHPQSQHEMRRYGVPEFDLVLEDVWRSASSRGFDRLSVAVFDPAPEWVAFDALEAFLAARWDAFDAVAPAAPGAVLGRLRRRMGVARRLASDLRHPATARAALRHLAHVRSTLANRRMFLLHKAGTEVTDSREVTGLAARIDVAGVHVERGAQSTVVAGTATVRNTGRNRWLPSSAGQGAVLLGLRIGRGAHPAADHGRVALPGDRPLEPGESVELSFSTEVPSPRPGEEALRLELDLVAEGIIWFAEVQGRPVEITVEPPPP